MSKFGTKEFCYQIFNLYFLHENVVFLLFWQQT